MRKWYLVLATTLLVAASFAPIAMAESAKLNATAEDGILVFESDDSAFKWWVDARVYLDVATYFDDGPLYNVDGPNYEDFSDLAEK